MHRSILVLAGLIATCQVACGGTDASPAPGDGQLMSGGGFNGVGGLPPLPSGGVHTGSGGYVGVTNSGGYVAVPGSGGKLVTFGNGGSIVGGGGSLSGGGYVGAGGFSEIGGSGAGGSGAGGGSTGGPTLPAAPKQTCPKFTNGAVVQIQRASGTNVPVYVYIDANAKSKPAPGGPLVVYWHATLQTPAEVHQGFGDANIKAVTDMGGVVAAPATTACAGCTTTDDGYWFVEDDVVLDTIVSCAIDQANIDVKHIHTLGWSAGGLHTTHTAIARNNYVASFISYSGGLFPLPSTLQNPTNKVAGILTYGDPGADVVILDFNAQSLSWYQAYQPKGWYSMMCHHPGGHEIDPAVAPHSLKFFMDHPFAVNPEPYATRIPSDFPAYCSNQSH